MAPIEIELDGQQIGRSAETYSVFEWPELNLTIIYDGDANGRRATVFQNGHHLTECVVKDYPTSVVVDKHTVPPIESGEPPTEVNKYLTLTRILESLTQTE